MAKKDTKKKKQSKYFLPLLLSLLVILTFILYSPTINYPFQYDDNHTILSNPQIDDLTSSFNINNWTRLRNDRQFARLTYKLNYAISELDTTGYHLTNILIHIINILLVFGLSYRLIRLYDNTIVINRVYYFAFFSALLFAVHPVQIGAVTYITQRMASLSALFYLTSCLLYIKARTLEKRNLLKLSALFSGAIICFPLAIWSKENAFSLPLMILVIEVFFIRNKEGKINKQYVLTFITVLVLIIIYFTIIEQLPKQTENYTALQYLYTQFTVILKYISLLIFPYNLRVFYNFPLNNSFFELRTLLSFIGILIIITTAIFVYRKYKIISFAIVWFFITLSVESSIIPLQYLIEEYRLYLPFLSYSIIISFIAIFVLFKDKINYAVLLLSSVCLIYGLITFSRNNDWKDEITLWTDNVEKEPEAAEPLNYLAYYYISNNQFDRAIELLNKSLKLKPDYARAYNNRGWAYFNKAEFSNAYNDFSKAIQYDTLNFLAQSNLGSALASLGRYDEAIANFKKAISMESRYAKAYYNAGICYYLKYEFDSAIYFYNKAIDINPEYFQAINNRGVVYLEQKIYDKAKEDFLKAISFSNDYYQAWLNLGRVYKDQGKPEDAIDAFTNSLRIKPDYEDALIERTFVFMKTGRTKLALEDAEKCSQLYPGNKTAVTLRDEIKKLLK